MSQHTEQKMRHLTLTVMFIIMLVVLIHYNIKTMCDYIGGKNLFLLTMLISCSHI